MFEDIKAALEILKNGGIILYPSDTIWGMGCDATNEAAVRRIFEIKKRPKNKNMLVLMENPSLLDRYVEDVPEIAFDLIELSTAPLTIIFTNGKNLAKGVIGEDGAVGIRFTTEAFSRELIARFRKPIVSTSANISGESSPCLFRDIPESILSSVDYVVKYRQDDLSPCKPSSIIKLGSGGKIEILRF